MQRKILIIGLVLVLMVSLGCLGEDAETYFNRGNDYLNSGNYSWAISDYNKAIELDPKFAEAYYNRGLAYDYLGDSSRAISDYNKAIELNPKDADAYYNRGLAYLDSGDSSRAISD